MAQAVSSVAELPTLEWLEEFSVDRDSAVLDAIHMIRLAHILLEFLAETEEAYLEEVATQQRLRETSAEAEVERLRLALFRRDHFGCGYSRAW